MSHRPGRGIVNRVVEKYLMSLQRPRDKVLLDLEKDAQENSVPIVGPLCGNLLSLIATGCKAKNILEIGTATGYSGIWLARVAKKNSGKLTTIELDPKRLAIAKRSFLDAGVSDYVEVLQGDAKKLVPKIARKQRAKFDLVFEDVGDKSIYVDLLEHCISALRVGGYLIADNTLWGSRVADPLQNHLDTKTIRKFNELAYRDKRLLPVLVPLRDGMTVCLKTGN